MNKDAAASGRPHRLSASHRDTLSQSTTPSPVVHRKPRNPHGRQTTPASVPPLLHAAPNPIEPRPASPGPSSSLTPPSPEALPVASEWRYVAFDPAHGAATVRLGSSVEGLREVAGLLEAALAQRLRTSTARPSGICAAADALGGFLLAFRPCADTVRRLIGSEDLWWQLAEASADTFELSDGPGASSPPGVRFARQQRTGPVAALVSALIDCGDQPQAAEVFKACTDTDFRQRVLDKLELDQTRPLARLQDPGPFSAALADVALSGSRLSLPRSGRSSRRQGSREASRSPHQVPQPRRSSQNLRETFVPPWKTEAVLRGLRERLDPVCGPRGWHVDNADGGIRLVAFQADARFPSDLLLEVVERLQIEPGTEQLHLDVIETLQQGLEQDPGLPAWRDEDPQVMGALQHLQTSCAAAYRAALARGDMPGASKALHTLEGVFRLTDAHPEALRTLEAELVGGLLVEALNRRDAAAADRLLPLLVRIEDAAVVFCDVLGKAAGACTTAADALALIAMVTRFLTSNPDPDIERDCGVLANLVLRYWPGEFQPLLKPGSAAPRPDAPPGDSAATERLAQWIWLCRSLNTAFDWTQAPALRDYCGHRWSKGFELALPIKRLQALHGKPELPPDRDAIEAALVDQVQQLPPDAQARLLYSLHGPDGLRLYSDSAPDPLLEGLLFWCREAGDTAVLLNHLEQQRHRVPPLFRAMLDALAKAPPTEWRAPLGALLAQVARHVVPAAVGEALMRFITARLAASRAKDINALLPVVAPLLPRVHRQASVALTKLVDPLRLRRDELAHFCRHLVFASQDDFLNWFKGFYSDPRRDGLIRLLRGWLKEHPDTSDSPWRLWDTVQAAVFEMQKAQAAH